MQGGNVQITPIALVPSKLPSYKHDEAKGELVRKRCSYPSPLGLLTIHPLGHWQFLHQKSY